MTTLFEHKTAAMLFIAISLIWILPWKVWALWRAAQRGEKWWFVILLVFNTMALLELYYLFIFTKKNKDMKAKYTNTTHNLDTAV